MCMDAIRVVDNDISPILREWRPPQQLSIDTLAPTPHVLHLRVVFKNSIDSVASPSVVDVLVRVSMYGDCCIISANATV
jgi:hypothetical protein